MVPRVNLEGRLPGGQRIVLRPHQAGDVEATYLAVRESLAELSPWMGWCHERYSHEDSRAWVATRPTAWERGDDYSFVVVDAARGALLGACGLNHIVREHRFANLGYWVRTSATGRGVASTATRLVAEFGFRHLGLRRVEIVAAVENLASQRVAQKAGAVREGVLRNRLVVRDQTHDAVMFSLTPEDLAMS